MHYALARSRSRLRCRFSSAAHARAHAQVHSDGSGLDAGMSKRFFTSTQRTALEPASASARSSALHGRRRAHAARRASASTPPTKSSPSDEPSSSRRFPSITSFGCACQVHCRPIASGRTRSCTALGFSSRRHRLRRGLPRPATTSRSQLQVPDGGTGTQALAQNAAIRRPRRRSVLRDPLRRRRDRYQPSRRRGS